MSDKLGALLGAHGKRTPPAYMVADAPGAPKKDANGKWIVNAGLGAKHADLGALLNAPSNHAVDVSRKKLPWKSALSRISCENSIQSKRGVLGLELKDAKDESSGKGVVVVKVALEGAQETFSALLAESLRVRCPKIRVLDASEKEYEDLKEAAISFVLEDPYQHAKVAGYLRLKQFLLMEAAVQCVSLGDLRDEGLTIDMLYDLGLLMSLDMILANGDRMPLQGLWNRPGNTDNFLFQKNDDGSSVTFAIDQVCVHPNNVDMQREYLSKLEHVLSNENALVAALGATTAFLERELGKPLVAGAVQMISAGIQQGIRRAVKLSRGSLVELASRVENMVPFSDPKTDRSMWDESLGNVNIDMMCDVLTVFQASPLSRVCFEREEGLAGLSRIIDSALKLKATGDTAVEMFFDFDRTLTNGLASSGDLPLLKRVRGGEQSVTALRAAAQARLPMYIVTARSPRRVVVEQLVTSLRGPQKEIGEFFLSPEQLNAQVEPCTEQGSFCGHQLAYATDARLYASDYQKPAALAHALCKRYSANDKDATPICVFFVDDVSTNAHDVGSRLVALLAEAGRQDLVQRVMVRSVWWDTFREDTGEAPTMLPEFGKTEQAYQDFMMAQLLDFGVSGAEARRRRELYAAEDKTSGRPKREKQAPKVGKLRKASAAQEKLAGFLFGGGKNKPSS